MPIRRLGRFASWPGLTHFVRPGRCATVYDGTVFRKRRYAPVIDGYSADSTADLPINVSDEPQSETLGFLALASVGLGFVLILISLTAAVGDLSRANLSLLSVILMFSAWAAWTIRQRGIALAGTVLSGGFALALAVILRITSDTQFAFLFALVVIAAAAMSGPRHGFLWAFITTCLTALAIPPSTGETVSPSVLVTSFLVWGIALIAWQGFRSANNSARWAWTSYSDSLRLSHELRVRQGELTRLSKSLNEACERLELQNSELERARAAANKARHAKSEFAAYISHELRTPLNLIIGFSEMMTIAPQSYGKEALPATYRGDIEAVYRNACHLSSLVDDVLDLSQIEAGRIGLHKERVALTQVIDEALSAVTSLFNGKALSLSVDLPAQPVIVQADRTRIRQVLINILTNAARYTERGGVQINARLGENDVVLSVTDTGPGIPPDEIPHMFEEYHHIDRVSQRRGGHGLGLAISKRIIEFHGGSMWVQSELGLGTTLAFSLPVCASVVAVPLRPEWETWAFAPRIARPTQPTVLLIDPDGMSARTLPRYLDEYSVRVVGDLKEARLVAKSCQPHAVIVTAPTDELAWLELCAARASFRDLPVAAYTIRDHRILARDLGVAEYLTKPVSTDQIRRALDRLGRTCREVVIVEDDPEMLALLRRVIRSISRRFRIREASNGADGLRLIRELPPDVVFLDLMMPERDGYEVVGDMRSDLRLREVPVIVITAYGREDESTVSPTLTITRARGITMREFARCLVAAVGESEIPEPARRQDSAPVR
jgi:signal transduction histidine kinase/DNA-binding response OmpR family regulator